MAVKSRYIFYVIIVLKAAIIGGLIWQFIRSGERFSLNDDFWIFLLVGFVAQIIDGTLGMAYGVTCSSFLLNLGVPRAVASARVHTAEVFTTGVSGISHLVMKNVDKKLFFRIVIPGIIGAVLGAFLLSEVLQGDIIKPFVAGYLLVLGILIVVKSFKEALFKDEIGLVSPLGLIGGFLDAIGGGGWGPIVTSNIIRKGKTPQLTIGTVNTAEFFVAFASTGVFIFFLGLEGLETILGLIIGGIIAAPLGAYLIRYIKPRTLMFIVGCVIVITSTYTIYKTLMQ